MHLILVAASFNVNGQNDEAQPALIHLSVGNGIALGANVTDSLLDVERTKTPVITVGLDHLITHKFSIGVMAGYQNINLQVSDTFGTLTEKGGVNRMYVGFRGLWHYGSNDKIDLYSGFQLGYKMFRTGKIKGPNANNSVIEEDNNKSGYSLAVVPIGARFFITDQWGAHVQTSIGAPNFISVGVNYRF